MKEFYFKYFRSKHLFAKCIVVSLALHSAVIYIWIKHPIFFTNSNPLLFLSSKSPLQPGSKEELSLDSAVDEFFEDFFVAANQKFAEEHPVYPKNDPSFSFQGAKQEEIVSPLFLPNITLKPLERPFPESFFSPLLELSTEDAFLPLIPLDFAPASSQPLAYQKEATYHSLPTFASENSALTEDVVSFGETSSAIPQPFESEYKTFFASKPRLLEGCSLKTHMQEKPELFTSETENAFPLSTIPNTFANTNDVFSLLSKGQISDIDTYLSTQALYSMQWNDSFSITPSFFPDEEGEGYIFSLTVDSKENLEAEKVRQNFYFLVDVSSDIENHKISVFKRAVIKALSSLRSGDTFNIFLMDKKIIPLSPRNIPFSFQNLRKAEDFLEKKHERAMFASFDLFTGLEKILEKIQGNEEMHTAVLLTNGKISGSLSHQKKEFANFLQKNQGKVSFFTAAVGKNNDLLHLDMISSLSGGKLLYSDTNAALPRKLSSFVKSLQGPLAKDVHLSIRTNDPKAEIVLLPQSAQTCHLYQQEPFVIMGKTNRLCDLLVSIEGKNEGGWVLISKEVNFANAQESSLQTKKEWSLRQASVLYEKFLKDGDGEHLNDAKEILKMTHGRTLGE